KRTQEAIQVLDRAVALYPDDVRPRAGRGVLLARLGQRKAALRDAEAALAQDTSAANLFQVAGIYALTSKKDEEDRREAFRLLSTALRKGFGFEYLEVDHDLDPIRNDLQFRRLVDACRVLQLGTTRKR